MASLLCRKCANPPAEAGPHSEAQAEGLAEAGGRASEANEAGGGEGCPPDRLQTLQGRAALQVVSRDEEAQALTDGAHSVRGRKTGRRELCSGVTRSGGGDVCVPRYLCDHLFSRRVVAFSRFTPSAKSGARNTGREEEGGSLRLLMSFVHTIDFPKRRKERRALAEWGRVQIKFIKFVKCIQSLFDGFLYKIY